MLKNLATGLVLRLVQNTKSYLASAAELYRLNMVEKLSRSITFFISSVLFTMLVVFLFFFLSIAGALYLGLLMGGDFIGAFLILAGFYLLLLILVIIFRDRIIDRNVLRSISRIIEEGNEQ
jgi:hypothetical protein